jgi:ABC-type Mn2+/Zn2+ transport system ATPase subunit
MFDHRLLIQDLTVSYYRIPAVHHVSLELRCGNCVALLGPNGAGKTSLLKAIVGLLPRESGSVAFHGHSVKPSNTDIAYLPQRSVQDIDFPITVRGVVELGRFMRLGWWQRFGARDREVVDEVLESLHLFDLSDRQFSALSGGQQQRVFLGRALAQEAHVFLLDEPLSGLDKGAQEMMRDTMRAIAERGNLVIASHHDMATVPELFDQVILLNGELIAFGDTAATFTEENIHRTFDTEVFSGTGHHHGHGLVA